MMQPWDGDAFRRGVGREGDNAKRYADQLARELKREPSRSKETIRDQFLGESFACMCLDQSPRADDRLDLIAFIDELMIAMPTDMEASDQKQYQDGFRMKLREIRSRI